MNADELDPKAVTHKSDFQDPVSVERANFSWEADNVRKILSGNNIASAKNFFFLTQTYFCNPVTMEILTIYKYFNQSQQSI